MESKIGYLGKTIFYRVEGEGETVVFLHGFMEDVSMWDAFVKSISLNYQVITIDIPGHGKSDNIDIVHSMELMADIVKEVLFKENETKCVLIGHSLGGYITLAFAEKYPNMLKGFGLFHSHTLADTPEAKINRERTIALVRKEKMGFINQFIPSLFAKENRVLLKAKIDHQIALANKMQSEGIIAALAGMKDRPLRIDVVAESKVPVLFILGKQDERIPFEKAMAQAATSSMVQINILANSGHMAWLEEQAESIAIVNGFVGLCQSN